MRYKLIVSDLDGTLLNAEHRLGSYTRDVLLDLQARGAEIVLASGRHHRDIRSLSSLLGGRGCLISSNGAAIHDRSGEAMSSRAIDRSCLDFLLRDPLFDAVHINVYRQDDWLVQEPKPQLLRYHQDSGFAYRTVDFRDLDDSPVLKVFYYHDDVEHLRHIESRVRSILGDLVTTTYSLPIVLEVMAHGVSKGDALAQVLARLGVDAEEVIAFGDGPNDLEMLRYAGKGILVANASPTLRAQLPFLDVIGPNEDEAVARYLAGLA